MVHRAYAKKAQGELPSLEEYEDANRKAKENGKILVLQHETEVPKVAGVGSQWRTGETASGHFGNFRLVLEHQDLPIFFGLAVGILVFLQGGKLALGLDRKSVV